jgi:hypothetical protein
LNKNLAELAKRALDQNLQVLLKGNTIRPRTRIILGYRIIAIRLGRNWLGTTRISFSDSSSFGLGHPRYRLRTCTRLGWLTQVGVSKNNSQARVYAFFHPIFHEYFAAQDLVLTSGIIS